MKVSKRVEIQKYNSANVVQNIRGQIAHMDKGSTLYDSKLGVVKWIHSGY